MKWHTILPVFIFVYNVLAGALWEHWLQGCSSITCCCRCSRRLPLPACLLLRQQRNVAWAQWGRWGTDTVEDKWPYFLIRSCVSRQNTEAPDSALIQSERWTWSGARAGSTVVIYKLCFHPHCLSKTGSSLYVISDHWCHFVRIGFTKENPFLWVW